MMHLSLTGSSLTIDDLERVAHDVSVRIDIAEHARERVRASRAAVDRWIDEGRVIYGMTTGFGEFANVAISRDDVERLQENLIISHSAGTGEPLPSAVVRAMMVLRINALAKGYSGIRETTLDALVAIVNAGIVPHIPSQGSVGSSGDLAPLSHLALCLIGKGECLVDGVRTPSADVLRAHGIEPVRLAAKEGLALINGTQMMCAFGALSVARARRLARLADLSGSMSLDAMRGTDAAFDDRLHAVRPHPGQRLVAENLRTLLYGSEIRESHRTGDGKVQDAYSLRCMPQVHGASRDTIEYAASVIEREMNSATDNPLIFADDDAHIQGGNFHGQPLALVLDFLAIAIAELANISERRTERLVNHALGGLPRFLTREGGLNSGMMIAQYTAAALVSENKVLAHPASVDSIPTSANQEDHNSMGSIAARKLWDVMRNVEAVVGIEILCASRGIEMLRPLRSSEPLERAMSCVRKVVAFTEQDVVLYHDIEAVNAVVRDGSLLRATDPDCSIIR
ncbi:MAG: histidine ammonia-lyase [Candidatus Kapabacteria bacterium]|nr:histidine ammonia-lyase [Candidatus Kapabacteria bacterium]